MSESGSHGVPNAIFQWAALLGLVLTQAKTCIDDDKENVITRTQVSGLELQVKQLEEERMTLGRIEERVTAMDERQGRFERFVEQQFRDLQDDKKRRR